MTQRSALWRWSLGLSAAVSLVVSGVSVPAPSHPDRPPSPRVSANGETLLGALSPTPGVDAYLGIPFAEPPTGKLRWRAPVAFVGRDSERSATDFAPACMQSPRILDWYRGMAERFGASRSVFPDLAVSEDCLYLNVWAPRERRGERLPVLVFFHGGSNRSGWSFEPNYHGHRLAAQGAVVVTIAYRLGVFGFFSHPELAGEPAQANFGLWDQLAALRWVQRHIAAFGGDRGRVTLFGESAGGGDIAALMLSPTAHGLMHRAIIQSGGDFGWAGIRTLEAEQQRGVALARALDIDQPPDLAALRDIDAGRLLEVAERVFSEHYHAPVVDGVIVTGPLRQQLATADWPLQQLIIGTNADETYSDEQRGADEAAIDAAVVSAVVLNTDAVRAELRSTPDAATALNRLGTADSMLCPAQQLATAVALGRRQVWTYLFSRVREGAAAARLRAYHGAELPYVFGTHDDWLPTVAVDRRITREMMQAWVTFAATGTPEGERLPSWPRHRPDIEPRMLRFDAITGPIAPPEAALCAIYRERTAASPSQN